MADTAACAALPLAETRIELNHIALEAKGRLEVSKTGDILYSFPADFDAVYKAHGARLALEKTLAGIVHLLFLGLRVSFGILLVASFVTIVVVFAVALLFIILGIGAAEGADGDLDGMGLDFDFFDLGELGMFFSWRSITGGDDSEKSIKYLGLQVEEPNRGFFCNCFSFLFGDGDPNKDVLDKQWQYVADLIRLCNGVVTAEQVSPYLRNGRADEEGILPVLIRFDGIPEVTEQGNIVYMFPSLQVTAMDPKLAALPSCLQEEFWKFSKLSMERLQWVFFFAGANLCGAYALWRHLDWFQPLIPYAAQVNWLMMYAVFFMSFPIVRELLNNIRNVFIDANNRLRVRQAQALSSRENQEKILAAQAYAQKKIVLSREQVYYSTGKDLLEQEFDQM